MDKETITEKKPWHCLHLFTLRPYDIRDYFKENGFETFIPEQWVDFEDRLGKRKHELRPVVKNLLFIETQDNDKKLKELIRTNEFKMSLIKTSRNSDTPAIISAKEMEEFKIMCNPELAMTLYISGDEAKLKQGDSVVVTNGPLKGLSGKLVRKSKKYYLLKEIPGIGVLLKVSRWCCRKTD